MLCVNPRVHNTFVAWNEGLPEKIGMSHLVAAAGVCSHTWTKLMSDNQLDEAEIFQLAVPLRRSSQLWVSSEFEVKAGCLVKKSGIVVYF